MGYINRKTGFSGELKNDGRLMSADETITYVMESLRMDMRDGFKPNHIYRVSDFDDKNKMKIEIRLIKTDEEIPELKNAKEKGFAVFSYGVNVHVKPNTDEVKN